VAPVGNPGRGRDHDLGPSNERHAPNLGITRDGLMSGLSGAVRAQIRYSTTITSVDGSAGEPEVALSDGTRGRFDLVVGADGIRSAVRKPIYPHIEAASVILRVADGHGVPGLRSSIPAQHGARP